MGLSSLGGPSSFIHKKVQSKSFIHKIVKRKKTWEQKFNGRQLFLNKKQKFPGYKTQ